MSEVNGNKAVVARLTEVFNGGDVRVLDDLIEMRFYDHTFGADAVLGPDHIRRIVETTRAAFPDYQVTNRQMVAEGELVVAVQTSAGTHQGDFHGIKPTGRRVEFDAIAIFRVVNGRIVEHRGIADQLTLLQQLGALHP